MAKPKPTKAPKHQSVRAAADASDEMAAKAIDQVHLQRPPEPSPEAIRRVVEVIAKRAKEGPYWRAK
jgi:hypothetical protein